MQGKRKIDAIQLAFSNLVISPFLKKVDRSEKLLVHINVLVAA